MPDLRKPPVSYAPRGVTKKPIALRLLAPEQARHETLAEMNGSSSASFARQLYLRGLKSYERSTSNPAATCKTNTPTTVNRA